jgi:DNA (cytosine-5)-methyltransferase 1
VEVAFASAAASEGLLDLIFTMKLLSFPVISLFPGADIWGMAFESQGFCMVRGPELMLGADIRNFHCRPGAFWGIIGSPPCQAFSKATKISKALNLYPEFNRIKKACKPAWWISENVPEAPVPDGAVWEYLADAWEFGAAQHRTRRFASNIVLDLPSFKLAVDFRHPDPWPTVTASEWRCTAGSGERAMRQRAGRKVGRRLTQAEMNEAMGLPREWDTPCLKWEYGYIVRGNGVPFQMGVALAKAVKKYFDL